MKTPVRARRSAGRASSGDEKRPFPTPLEKDRNGLAIGFFAPWSKVGRPPLHAGKSGSKSRRGSQNLVGPTLLKQRQPRINNSGIRPLSYDRNLKYS
jgi:hypothetical protein